MINKTVLHRFGLCRFSIMRLEASDLSIERGGRILFARVSFAIEAGASLTVTGPNGAGKSSLLRALAGLLPLRQGRIQWLPSSDERLAEKAHYIGHSDALKGSLTAVENVNLWAAMLGAGSIALSAQAALATLGLAHVADLPAAYLSAGQKRRVALARLLVAERPVWLLDEPSTALDLASLTLCQKIMASHLGKGGMIIAATHAPLGLGGAELRLNAPA
jgi:heme exporter protein A